MGWSVMNFVSLWSKSNALGKMLYVQRIYSSVVPLAITIVIRTRKQPENENVQNKKEEATGRHEEPFPIQDYRTTVHLERRDLEQNRESSLLVRRGFLRKGNVKSNRFWLDMYLV